METAAVILYTIICYPTLPMMQPDILYLHIVIWRILEDLFKATYKQNTLKVPWEDMFQFFEL